MTWWRFISAGLGALAVTGFSSGTAWAKEGSKAGLQAREVNYGPPGAWVRPPPLPTQTPNLPAASVRIVYFDQQVRVVEKGVQFYTASRTRLLKPEALRAGNLSLNWNPSSGTVTVHTLRIHRDGQVTDILPGSRFTIIQRESGLEAARITGGLTAALQVPGLRVGDELELATTVQGADPTIGDKAWGLLMLQPAGALGTLRSELVWPTSRSLQWRATSDFGELAPISEGGVSRLSIELRDPKPVVAAEGAPSRFNLRRLLQFSDYADWAELSRRFYPLYAEPSKQPADPSLRAEIDRIATAHPDTAGRALAALKLVQNEVRYVYVGFNGGNFRPMAISETWKQRMGDCKAKTVLLLALLHDLGVPAEAVLVNAAGLDGTDRLLPSPLAFDHVLVRATVDGRAFWLDGTRMGDGALEPVQPMSFRWALPLRAADAKLESVPVIVPRSPLFTQLVTMEPTGKEMTEGKVSVEHLMRGDEALATHMQLSAMSAEAAEQGIREYWRSSNSWITPEKVGWSFDEAKSLLRLSVNGIDKEAGIPGSRGAIEFEIAGAQFSKPDKSERPPEQDQTLPWATGFPYYKCWVTNIRLPDAGPGNRWETKVAPIDKTYAGVRYLRRAEIRDGVLRAVMVIRTDRPEVSADEVSQANLAYEKFDSESAQVFKRQTVKGFKYPPTTLANAIATISEVDWSKEATPCSLD